MKYKVDDVLFSRLDTSKAGRTVLDIKPFRGGYEMPYYKFVNKESKSGFVWVPEWMLKSAHVA